MTNCLHVAASVNFQIWLFFKKLVTSSDVQKGFSNTKAVYYTVYNHYIWFYRDISIIKQRKIRTPYLFVYKCLQVKHAPYFFEGGLVCWGGGCSFGGRGGVGGSKIAPGGKPPHPTCPPKPANPLMSHQPLLLTLTYFSQAPQTTEHQ